MPVAQSNLSHIVIVTKCAFVSAHLSLLQQWRAVPYHMVRFHHIRWVSPFLTMASSLCSGFVHGQKSRSSNHTHYLTYLGEMVDTPRRSTRTTTAGRYVMSRAPLPPALEPARGKAILTLKCLQIPAIRCHSNGVPNRNARYHESGINAWDCAAICKWSQFAADAFRLAAVILIPSGSCLPKVKEKIKPVDNEDRQS